MSATLVPCASAQVADHYQEGCERLVDGDVEGAITALEEAEEELEEAAPARASEARWQLARAYEALGEPDEQRYYLTRVVEDPHTYRDTRRRAEARLAEIESLTRRPESYRNPLEDDPLQVAGLVFAALEIVALITGGILHAESNCVDDPMPCSHTMRDVSLGFLVAGTLWWTVPTAFFVAIGVLSGGGGAPRSLRDGALLRF
ncbi:MAG: hypothetical protein KC619_33710 [Myxococcales bacterium]|nr:hypothetical protein [Myxococcales bacterium]